MNVSGLISTYMLPVGLAALLLLALLAVLALLARRGIVPGAWRWINSHRIQVALLAALVLVAVGLGVYYRQASNAAAFRDREAHDLLTASNLISFPVAASGIVTNTALDSWNISGTTKVIPSSEGWKISLGPHSAARSSIVPVRPGETYRYSASFAPGGSYASGDTGIAQVRFLWLDKALSVLSWSDAPQWRFQDATSDSPSSFRTGAYTAPPGAAGLQLEFRSLGEYMGIAATQPKLSQDGVYIEPNPNGTQGSLAFSFDWESAMGGAIHSKGMATHDPAGATQHGMEMRQGADWLAQLFAKNGIKATFYATGYNLLDGNTQHLTFSGDPIYRWASPKNGWASDYWLTHKWYGDDPHGTIQSDPAWYFGDQTRALLQAGHEVAPHTFGHLYVRGTRPAELATDMDEWLKHAKTAGVGAPTTFAFPWRSSNSLTADFYRVLYDRGIRAVTRIYERDLKDQYTIGAAPVYTAMQVMPDFLLGAGSATMGEENAGHAVGGDEGVRVIQEAIARRGTTSFWQHPEQLANTPSLQSVRDAWEKVVTAAAQERDRGRLWIATVADITAYQRDLHGVSVALDKSSGGWKIVVTNALDHPIKGLTLTLPGDLDRVTSADTDVRTVTHPDAQSVKVSDQGHYTFPARQLVLPELKPGSATINIEWAPGQEPLQ